MTRPRRRRLSRVNSQQQKKRRIREGSAFSAPRMFNISRKYVHCSKSRQSRRKPSPTVVSVFISTLDRGIDYIIVLVGVEALVGLQEHDSDLRHRLRESEAEVAALREDLAWVSAERTTGSRLAIRAHTALGGLES
jgi:hypothetical protein